ncbi:hypothetical protein NM688_g6329 [Phlebia brevispora]|uniref:Uncharacterized protein n=1 Tax=Phlebia brevispora TaxID=194682 RepID=A0ACC1SHI3_9APHY|nr:hypothetical protein NM688_g6329 [Phlebia brevispora]
MPPIHVSQLVPCSSRIYATDVAAQESDRDPENANVEPVVPEPMQYRDVPAVVRMIAQAAEEMYDPLEHYMNDTPDKGDAKWKENVAYMTQYYHWTKWAYDKKAWTINHDHTDRRSSTPPPKDKADSPLDKMLDGIADYAMASTRTKQQTKRFEEFLEKIRKAVRSSCGDRLQDMFYISGVATAPAKQRRGYASTLMRMACTMADERNSATWLVVGNVPANNAFYAAFGFVTVAQTLLGDEDPDWTEDPVPVDVMVREPSSAAWKEKAELV